MWDRNKYCREKFGRAGGQRAGAGGSGQWAGGREARAPSTFCRGLRRLLTQLNFLQSFAKTASRAFRVIIESKFSMIVS